jgi:RHS repeat-associated protein
MGRMTAAGKDGSALATWLYGSAAEPLARLGDGHETLYVSDQFEVRDGTAMTYVTLDEDRRVRIEEPSYAAKVLPDLAPASGDDAALEAGADGTITSGDAWLVAAAAAGALSFKTADASGDARVLLNASARRMLFGTGTRVVYMHLDPIGSVVATTGDDGKVLSRDDYYPYGTSRFHEGEDQPYGYTGKETDPATGLIAFGARFLDPWSGRWTAPDPSFRTIDEVDEGDVAEATWTYGFVGGNPVTGRDPDGQVKAGCVTSFLGRVKTALAIRKGEMRPSVAYHYIFNLTPNQKINFKTAWNMVKFAGRQERSPGLTQHAQAFYRKGQTSSFDMAFEVRQAGTMLATLTRFPSHFDTSIAPRLSQIAQGIDHNPVHLNETFAKMGYDIGQQQIHDFFAKLGDKPLMFSRDGKTSDVKRGEGAPKGTTKETAKEGGNK